MPVDAQDPAAGNTRLAKVIIIAGGAAILLFTATEWALVFFTQIGGEDKKPILMAMDVTSGLFGGTALALYVGRIGSKFLNPPDWLIPAFYFYAVIQPLYLFIQNDTGGAFIIGGALILKSLLYLYMAWLFKSGRLLFYMVRVRAIYESVNAQWKDFLWNLDKA